MVHSLTALRTLIASKYNLSAVKTPEGLLVAGLSLTDISEEHKICYKCEATEKGVLFKLDGYSVRPLPATKDNFLLRCYKSTYIDIVEQKTLTDTSIELTASNDPIIRSPNNGYGNFLVCTVRMRLPAEALLSKCSYEQSTKDPSLYRVYFRIGGVRKADAWDRQDIASLVEMAVKDNEEAEWKGLKWKAIKEMIKNGLLEKLFVRAEETVLEKGIW